LNKKDLNLMKGILKALQWLTSNLAKPLTTAPRTGRVAMQASNWALITTDPWVLEQIRGHRIELMANPLQDRPPTETVLPVDRENMFTEEIGKLLEKEAISAVSEPQAGTFISRMFLVPKKKGSQRPIIDLRELKKFVHWEHFKMEGIHLVKDLLQEGDWLIKIDLKDAYFAIPIDQTHRPLLSFQWKGNTYQFNCLPFGLSLAPRIFTKILRPVIAWLRQLGCRLISYIDDNLLIAPSKQEATLMSQLATQLFEALEFSVNYPKSVLEPTQSLEFLGLIVDSVSMTITAPERKLASVRPSALKLMKQHTVTGRELARFIGTTSSLTIAIPPAPLFYQDLQRAKNFTVLTRKGLDSELTLSPSQKQELQW
jgi:hypothetical protein